MRVHSNVGLGFSRQLPLAFNTLASAIGSADPNTLNTNGPRLSDAMAIAGHEGIISLIHDSGAQRTITVWGWSELLHKASAGVKGWFKLGRVATDNGNAILVDPYSMATVLVTEGQALFISADANITNCLIGGTQKHSAQALADIAP